MNPFAPIDQVKTGLRWIGRGAVAIIVVVGVLALVHWVGDPFGWVERRLENAEASAAVNGQQADSNAAGAAINDSRATNVANIKKTAQEARHALATTPDHDDRLRLYLDALDQLRRDGAAPIADPSSDDQRQDPDAGHGEAGVPRSPAGER